MSGLEDFLFLSLITILSMLGVLSLFERLFLFLEKSYTCSTPTKSPFEVKLETLKKLEIRLEEEKMRKIEEKNKKSDDDPCLLGTVSSTGSKYMKMEDIQLCNKSVIDTSESIKEIKKEINKFLLGEIENMAFKNVINHVRKFGYELKVIDGGIYVAKKGPITTK